MPLVLSGTDGVSGVDGTASNPSYEGTDSNTGIFFPAADTIAFAEGGAEVARFDSAGNFGIGTSSPASNSLTLASKDVVLSDGYGPVWGTTTKAQIAGYASGILQFFAGGPSERMRIDSSGNVGIGTSSPATRLDVQGSNVAVRVKATAGDYALIDVDSTALKQPILRFLADGVEQARILSPANSGASILSFCTGTAAAERARIDASGTLFVGTTSNPVLGSERLGVVNSTHCFGFKMNNSSTNTLGGLWSYGAAAAGGGTYIAFYNGSGAANIGSISHTASATAYNTTSDYRLKENVQPMTGALAKVAELKPCTYTWKSDGSAGEGFIAHELAEVVPDAVTGKKDAVNEDGSIKPQGIDTSFLVATLTAAIQEQQQMIAALQAKVAALEEK